METEGEWVVHPGVGVGPIALGMAPLSISIRSRGSVRSCMADD